MLHPNKEIASEGGSSRGGSRRDYIQMKKKLLKVEALGGLSRRDYIQMKKKLLRVEPPGGLSKCDYIQMSKLLLWVEAPGGFPDVTTSK